MTMESPSSAPKQKITKQVIQINHTVSDAVSNGKLQNLETIREWIVWVEKNIQTANIIGTSTSNITILNDTLGTLFNLLVEKKAPLKLHETIKSLQIYQDITPENVNTANTFLQLFKKKDKLSTYGGEKAYIASKVLEAKIQHFEINRESLKSHLKSVEREITVSTAFYQKKIKDITFINGNMSYNVDLYLALSQYGKIKYGIPKNTGCDNLRNLNEKFLKKNSAIFPQSFTTYDTIDTTNFIVATANLLVIQKYIGKSQDHKEAFKQKAKLLESKLSEFEKSYQNFIVDLATKKAQLRNVKTVGDINKGNEEAVKDYMKLIQENIVTYGINDYKERNRIRGLIQKFDNQPLYKKLW